MKVRRIKYTVWSVKNFITWSIDRVSNSSLMHPWSSKFAVNQSNQSINQSINHILFHTTRSSIIKIPIYPKRFAILLGGILLSDFECGRPTYVYKAVHDVYSDAFETQRERIYCMSVSERISKICQYLNMMTLWGYEIY